MRASVVVGLAAVGAVSALFSATPPAQADAGRCYYGDVMRGSSGDGDWYLCLGDPARVQPGTWQHIVPFFDPNSADGYGGMQLLPPLCVRFPQDYPSCAGVIYDFPTGY